MARHRGQKWGARDLGMPGRKTWEREALKRLAAKRGHVYVDELLRRRTNPRRSGLMGMRDLDVIAEDRSTGVTLARLGARYVVAEPVRSGTSFHGWMSRTDAKKLYRTLTRSSNPPRDPIYVGAFRLGQEPKASAQFVDGDTAAVESPHRTRATLDRPYEVWVFGTIDPRLGETWNYVSGPASRSDAIEEAKRLART